MLESKKQQIEQLRWAIIKSPVTMAFNELLAYVKIEVINEPNYVAYTDGRRIYICDQFFDYGIGERVFILLHEVLHIALRHVVRLKEFQFKDASYSLLWNYATDAVINNVLEEALKSLRLEFDYNPPADLITFDWIASQGVVFNKDYFKYSAEEVFRLLLTLSENKQKKLGQHSMLMGDLQPSDKPGENEAGGQGSQSADDSETDVTVAGDIADGDADLASMVWAERMRRLSHGLEANSKGAILANLPKVTTPWPIVLKQFVSARVSRERESNYKMPSRRSFNKVVNFWEPSKQKKRSVDGIAILLDLSGSCFGGEIFNKFIAEIDSLQQSTKASIHLITFDVDAHYHELIKYDRANPFSQKLRSEQIKLVGGGGTSFIQALDIAAKVNPTCTIVLTDGYGDFPSKLPVDSRKTLWALLDEHGVQQVPKNFGRCLVIE